MQLELYLGQDSEAEAVDKHARRIRRNLLELGVSAELTPGPALPIGAKGQSGPALGRLDLTAPGEQASAVLQVLGQWLRQDNERATTLRDIPPDQFPLLVSLVLAILPRLPNPYARFSYRDGERQIEFDYDPAETKAEQLLAQVQAALERSAPKRAALEKPTMEPAGVVNIVAHGDITIGGSVAGRDLADRKEL